LNEGASTAALAFIDAADQKLRATRSRAAAISAESVGLYLGYFEKGYRLEFDSDDALWLRVGRRSFRIMALPGDQFVIASGSFAGNLVGLTTDANGDAWLAIASVGEKVRWLQGL